MSSKIVNITEGPNYIDDQGRLESPNHKIMGVAVGANAIYQVKSTTPPPGGFPYTFPFTLA